MADNRNTRSFADEALGPWMRPEIFASLPQLKRDYEHIAMNQHVAQSGEGRQSAMVGNSQPKVDLRPSAQIAKTADEFAFKSAWMKEQRDAAMAQARQQQNQQLHERDIGRSGLQAEQKLER